MSSPPKQHSLGSSNAPLLHQKAGISDNNEQGSSTPLPGATSELAKEIDGTQSPQSPGLLRGLAKTLLGLSITNTVDTASTPEDLTESTTSKDSKKPKGGEGNETAEELSDWEDCDNFLPGNPARHWEHLTTEEEAQDGQGWTLEADRHLCILWFFTPYSFSTIASLLNYSATQPPLRHRVYGSQAKERLIQLSTNKDYDRAFIYHETKRLANTKDIDWSSTIQETDHSFAVAWKRMRHDVDKAKEHGEKGRFTIGGKEFHGFDILTDAQLVRLRKKRKWSVKERKKLEGRKWEGLGVMGIRRPEVVGDGYETDESIERGEDGKAMKGGASKGWLW